MSINLHHYTWYLDTKSRRDVEAELILNKKSFIVSHSESQQGSYRFSIKTGSIITHYLITQNKEGDYKINGYPCQPATSIPLLVYYAFYKTPSRLNVQPKYFTTPAYTKQIEADLKEFFNISIKLANYADMKTLIEKLLKQLSSNNSVIGDKFIRDGPNITIRDNTYIMESNDKSSGSFNIVSYYKIGSKRFILRKGTQNDSDNLFDTFYENLKHLILFIIMTRYNAKKMLIPKPVALGWLDNNIAFISEAGEMDMKFHITLKNVNVRVDRLIYYIYKHLFDINGVPGMNLFFRHNDLKPDNVVIINVYDPYPLLIDFGTSIFTINGIDFRYPYKKNETGGINITRFDNNYNNIQQNAIHDIISLLCLLSNFTSTSKFIQEIINSINAYRQQNCQGDKGRNDECRYQFVPIIMKTTNNSIFTKKISPEQLAKEMNLVDVPSKYYIKYLIMKYKYLQLGKKSKISYPINKYIN